MLHSHSLYIYFSSQSNQHYLATLISNIQPSDLFELFLTIHNILWPID